MAGTMESVGRIHRAPLLGGPNDTFPVKAKVFDTSAITRAATRSTVVAPARRRYAPSRSSRGIGGTPLYASVEFLAKDTLNVGLFYRLSDRWTVGLIGQRLVQNRSVDVKGQLVDPNDLSQFVSGFSASEKTTSISFGPAAQFQLLKEQDARPAIYLGAYALEWGTLTDATTTFSIPSLIHPTQTRASDGDSPDSFRSIYASFSKRLPGFESSQLIRGWSVYGGAGYAARTGKRFTAAETGAGDPRVRLARKSTTRHSFVGWVGTEVAVPLDLALFGEVFTGDECVFGYSAGVRWTSPIGITLSLGVSNCVESIERRALDLVYLPGGVGGQPSVSTSAGGLDGGGKGYRPSEDDDDDDDDI